MAVDPKKLKAFAKGQDKSGGGGGGKAKPFGGGKKGGQPGPDGGGNPPDEDDDPSATEDEDETEDESDEEIAARVGAQVAAGKTDAQLMDLLDGYDPERDGDPPVWADDEGLWGRAKNAVEPSWDTYDKPYVVVAHVYKELDGPVSSAD